HQDDSLVDLSKPSQVENEREASEENGADDADMPSKPWRGSNISEAEYLRMRDEYIGLLRGISPGAAFDPQQRTRAIDHMQSQEMDVQKRARADALNGVTPAVVTPAWTEIGPKTTPIANGQYQ